MRFEVGSAGYGVEFLDQIGTQEFDVKIAILVHSAKEIGGGDLGAVAGVDGIHKLTSV